MQSVFLKSQVDMENDGMFRELIENSEDIIIVADKGYQIRYVSPSVSELFGVEPQALVGRNVFELVGYEKAEYWKVSLDDAGSSVADEIVLSVKKGEKLYFEVRISNLLDHYPIYGLVLTLHNITQQKQREANLIQLNQQLDQVIYKTTHDLKAPLRSALGLVSLAERASPEEKSQFIEMIRKSLLKLDSFIEEMNNFFRNEKLAIQRDKINIEELLKSELEDLTNLYQENKIRIKLDIRNGCEFYSDSVRVKTILTNILSNAIKYSDPKKGESFIKIRSIVNEEMCEIRVEDNGIGIEPQYQAKIYDLFFRATNHSQGTGLGLFIVKDTIEKLKGTIEVFSTVDEGTTFLIRIPNQIKISQPIEVA